MKLRKRCQTVFRIMVWLCTRGEMRFEKRVKKKFTDSMGNSKMPPYVIRELETTLEMTVVVDGGVSS